MINPISQYLVGSGPTPQSQPLFSGATMPTGLEQTAPSVPWIAPSVPGTAPTAPGIAPVNLFPVGDTMALSPEAMQPEVDMSGLLLGLSEAYGVPGQLPPDTGMAALQQQIAVVQQQLELATDVTEQQGLEQLLATLLGQLASNSGGGASGALGGVPAAALIAAPASSGGGSAPSSSGGSSAGSSGGAAPSGIGGSSAGSSGGSPATPSTDSGASEASEPLTALPPKLAKDDKKLAQHVEAQLKGSPLAGKGLGAHFVSAGRENDVDPLALAAISKHETDFGKLGVGIDKHMGVGAYDSSPDTPRQWDGATNQIYSGAKTFANLRDKGGSNSKAPMEQQLSAVNKAGWASDSGWHSKVGVRYNELTEKNKGSKAA